MTAPRPGRSTDGPAGPATQNVGSGGLVGDGDGRLDGVGDGRGTTVTVGGQADVARAGWSACVSGLLVQPVEARPGGSRRPPDRRPRRRGTPGGWDRGSVTAELAAALPALMVLLLTGVMAVSAAGTKIRCGSAARDAALAAARGEDGAAAAGRMAPDGASVRVATDGDLAHATVSAQVRPFGDLLPGFTVSSSAVAAVEPGSP